MSAEHHPLQEDLVIFERPTMHSRIESDYVVKVTPKSDNFWKDRQNYTEDNMNMGGEVFIPHNSQKDEK